MPRQPEVERYQILVLARDENGVEREVRIGPALQFKAILEEQCAVINRAVAEGREKVWREARVIPIDRVLH